MAQCRPLGARHRDADGRWSTPRRRASPRPPDWTRRALAAVPLRRLAARPRGAVAEEPRRPGAGRSARCRVGVSARRRQSSELRVTMDRVRVVRRWVDLAEFDPERVRGHRVSALAERWGLVAGAKVVVVPALPDGDRGHLLLLHAMARLPRTDCVALFAGGFEAAGVYGKELMAAVRRAGWASASVSVAARTICRRSWP